MTMNIFPLREYSGLSITPITPMAEVGLVAKNSPLIFMFEYEGRLTYGLCEVLQSQSTLMSLCVRYLPEFHVQPRAVDVWYRYCRCGCVSVVHFGLSTSCCKIDA